MPTKPRIVTLTNTSSEVLNAIKNSASQNYQNYVPYAQQNAESIRSIGAIIMDYPALQNEFLQALINRIGRVLVSSKLFSNPWAVFKRGFLEFGETTEEVFIDLAKPFIYDVSAAETDVFKTEMPDVHTAFHIMNYKTFYKNSIFKNQLAQAFLTENGIIEFIAKIVDKMYASAAYDEFQVMKYMLAYHIYNGNLHITSIPSNYTTVTDDVVSIIKGVSNMMEFPSRNYNMAAVANNSGKDNQYLIVSAEFDANMSVNVLATAFNMSQAEFMGHKILTDGFGALDVDRLDTLFGYTDANTMRDANYHHFTVEELTALNNVPAVLVDKDFFVILDNLTDFAEIYNSQGLYWNYFYHVWQTFSVSPFANATILLPSTASVTSITVSPSTATVAKGKTLDLDVTVVTSNFASKKVTWSINSTKSSIDERGVLTVASDETAETITVTATSVFNSSVTGTATITVAS